jgi:hypothetical protein
MKFTELIETMLHVDQMDKTAGSKDVIIVVDGLRLPFPDVTGVVANEDTIEIRARANVSSTS